MHAPPAVHDVELSREAALAALGLAAEYIRGEGSALHERGGTEPVWDFIGGYGAAFFGHNHPALVEVVRTFLCRGGVQQAQASIRGPAATLREEIARHLRAALGRNYEVMLANTGSEAAELASRHADLLFAQKRNELRRTLCDGASAASLHWSPEALALLEQLGLQGRLRTLADVADHNRAVLATPPLQLAVRRSFHGCTSRALELTWNPHARFGEHVAAVPVRFLDPDSTHEIQELLASMSQPLLHPRLAGDLSALECTRWTPVSALFVEPLQGEGGIHPLSTSQAAAWRQACRAYDVPIVADEIQSGMGRTGTLLYAEQIGLVPDYVLLGKSLGGGLAKISAVAIDAECSLPGFAMMYTSTFAEDDLSSLVAQRALALLDEENALERARERGERMRRVLETIAARYPAVVEEVRGCGLMMGISFRMQEYERSAALRFLQKYGWLGYAMAGYLLRRWKVRVAPVLSSGRTMRLEPAYDVPDIAIEQLACGLGELCDVLLREDAGALLAPALGTTSPATPLPPPRAAIRRPPMAESHVAFIGHFIDEDGVALWDEGLGRLDAAARRTFLDRVHPVADPLLCHRDHVLSPVGSATTLSFIGIPVSSQQCHDALRGPGREHLRALIQRAVDMAAEDGCQVVGLGGYCSILTRNGRLVRSRGMGVTTGNGLTVGAALLALYDAAEREEISLPAARAAVIGASGNIGSVLGALLAEEVGALTLLGRVGRCGELYRDAGRLLRRLSAEAPDAPLLRALRAHGYAWHPSMTDAEVADLCRSVQAALGATAPIVVGSDLHLCRDAQVIVTASNEPQPILFADHLGLGTSLIVDLAVPRDVDDSVDGAHPRARVLRGGVVRTPCNPNWQIGGIPLEPGEMFACMAETALMGLARERTGTLGTLTAERVRHTLSLARDHGFTGIRTGLHPSAVHPERRFA